MASDDDVAKNRDERQGPPEAFGRGDHPEPEKKDEKEADTEGKEEDKKDEPPKKPFWKRPVLMTVMIGVALLLIVGGIIWWLIARHYESTDDAFIDGRIVHVAPRVAGRVATLNVTDNQYVEADMVVIKLDPAPFQAALQNAQAAVQQARAKLDQSKAELAVQQANAAEAKATVQVAQANADNGDADYRRFQEVSEAARSQQQLDNAKAAAKSSDAQLSAAKKHATSTDAQVQSSLTSVDSAKAQLVAAEAQLDQSQLDLQYTDVTAGHAGYVTRRTVEVGNYAQVGQELMDIVPKNVWVTANFKETQLTWMRPGQPVEIKVDAYPGHKYHGHVDSIQTGTGAVFSLLPPENATGNFVKIVQRVPVKVIFDEELDRVLAPGMSVEPTVKVR